MSRPHKTDRRLRFDQKVYRAGQRLFDLRDKCPQEDEATWKVLDTLARAADKLSSRLLDEWERHK